MRPMPTPATSSSILVPASVVCVIPGENEYISAASAASSEDNVIVTIKDGDKVLGSIRHSTLQIDAHNPVFSADPPRTLAAGCDTAS